MGFFEILAECSITFAGFGAVHAMLMGSTGPRGAYRAWSTVLPGVTVFVLCLLVLLLDLSYLEGTELWRILSYFGGIVLAVQTSVAIGIDYHLLKRGHPPQSRYNLRTAQFVSVLATLTMLYSAIVEPSQFLFGTALLLSLVQGIIGFLLSFWLPLNISLEKS